MIIKEVFKEIISKVESPNKQRHLWFAFSSLYFDRQKREDGFVPVRMRGLSKTLHINRTNVKTILTVLKQLGILNFAYQKKLNRFKNHNLHGVYFKSGKRPSGDS